MRRSLFTGTTLFRAAALAAALLPVTAAGAGVDFDAQAPGTFLTTQLRVSHGVSFPNGVVVLALPDAPSAPHGAEAPYDGEFQRRPVDVRFAAAQDQVSIAFRPSQSPGATWDVTLTAYDAGNAVVAADAVRFNADGAWRTLAVGTMPATIRRVVLVGGLMGAPFPTNFLLVDDLRYTTVAPPPPPDTRPPAMAIYRPQPGEVVTGAMVEVMVVVEDAGTSELLAVTGTVVHSDTGTVVGGMDFCGSPASGPCPPVRLQETLPVELEPALEGPHVASVTACDDAGNCTTLDRAFEVELPEPPPEVTVGAVEVNQGVQPLLFDIGRPGTTTNASSTVRMVSGRDTALRFYPLSEGAPREDYAARLHVRILYRDGTALERFAMPNAGVPEVDVVPDPGSYDERVTEYLRMRPDRRRTLNYVVPGALLRDASVLEVTLDDPTPVTGWLRVGFQPEVRLAVKHLSLYGPGIGAGTAPTAAQVQNALRYVEETYPLTDLDVIGSAPARIADDAVCEVSSDDLGCAVWQFSFYDPPGTVPSSAYPTHLMKVGRVPYGSFPRVGIALWGSAIAMAYGDSAYAHEIAHTAGRPHAGGFHREAGGETWPFPHGQVGAMDFGVVTWPVAPPTVTDLGQWSLTVVDPCPGADVPMRRPVCALPDDEATHDFMSYGWGSPDLGPLNPTSPGRRWISSYTWNRLYDRLRSSATAARAEGLRRAAGGGANVEALLIDGLVREHGPVQPLPVLRLHVPEDRVADPPPGPYTLELFAENNTLLLSRSFEPGELHDAGDDRRFLLGQVVPYFAGLRRVVVRREGATVLVRTGSPRAPEVKVLHPNGGESLPSGIHAITWSVSDADGDRVLSRVEYSSDGGATWGTLGMVAGDEPPRLEIDVALLPPSANAKFRVTASDGFHTAADASDCPVAVGVDEPAVCGGPEVLIAGLDVKPGAANGCVNPESEGVIPAAVLGAADLDAAAVDPSTLALAGIRVRVRGGAPQCWLRDASGPLGRPDGIADRVCHFDNAGGGWDDEDGVAVLTGALLDGTPIRGTERVCRVP